MPRPRHEGTTAGTADRLVVWFVNQYAGSPKHGMEFRHYELGRELVKRGHTVIVISGSYSHLFTDAPAIFEAYTLENVDDLTYYWVRVPRYGRPLSAGRILNMLAFAARLYRFPVRNLPAPNAIVVSSPSPFPIVPVERWARRFRARFIFEVRDIWPLTLQELGQLSPYHPLVAVMNWLERRACRSADAVVSLLPAALPHFVAQGMTPNKFHVIPNGVTADALDEPSRPAPALVRAATANPVFTIGFVGTLGQANSLETLIEAARLLAREDLRFVVVGQGAEEGRLRAAAADLPNVIFVGPVAKAEVPATLRLFDACYVGYRRSPLYRFGISPNKVFDYMAAGRPIVLAADAANDPVQDAGAGLTVPPGDAAALAGAIRRLRAMPPAEREHVGRRGRAYIEREHTPRVLADRYLEVFAGGE